MRGEIEVKGVVLSSMPIGEYDKRVMILTDSLGKIHAFARGARKINSKLLAGTEPLTFATFKVFSGKNAYNISEIQIIDFFSTLKSDIEKLYYGYYFLEFAAYFSKENLDSKEILRLLYASFRALEEMKENQPLEFIRSVFEWKMFAIEGLMPDYKKGSILGISLSDTIKYTLEYILKVDCSKLFQFTLMEKEMNDFIKLRDVYHRLTIEKEFNSLKMIVRGEL